MPSFLLIIFLTQLGIHLLNSIGSARLGEWLWMIYNKLPTASSSSYEKVTRLRKEAVRLKRDLDATSAQDQFAKWAKIQRQYEKTKAEYDSKSNELSASEKSFKSIASVARWLVANGLRFYLQWRFGKVPMFWLPRGWVPGYVEWVLALPKAPSGSIGIQIWFVACASVIAIASEGASALWRLSMSTTEPASQHVKTMETEGSSGIASKKEL